MATAYEYGLNPFQDYLLNVLQYEIDISNIELKKDLNNVFMHILREILDNPDDAAILDFEIKKTKSGYYKVLGKNIISALWLSCVFPVDIVTPLKTNTISYSKGDFYFDKKKFKLTFVRTKN